MTQRTSKYPFAELDRYDYFEIEERDLNKKDALEMRVRASANYWRKRNDPDAEFDITTTPKGVKCTRLR